MESKIEPKDLFSRCLSINQVNLATILNGFKDLELLSCAKDYSLAFFSYLNNTESFSEKLEAEIENFDENAISNDESNIIKLNDEFVEIDGLQDTLNVLHEMVKSSILLSLVGFHNPTILKDCFGSNENILTACEDLSYSLLKEVAVDVFLENSENMELMFLNITQLQKALLNLNDGLSDKLKICAIDQVLSGREGLVDFNNLGINGIEAVTVGNTYNNFIFDLNEEFTNSSSYYA